MMKLTVLMKIDLLFGQLGILHFGFVDLFEH